MSYLPYDENLNIGYLSVLCYDVRSRSAFPVLE